MVPYQRPRLPMKRAYFEMCLRCIGVPVHITFLILVILADTSNTYLQYISPALYIAMPLALLLDFEGCMSVGGHSRLSHGLIGFLGLLTFCLVLGGWLFSAFLSGFHLDLTAEQERKKPKQYWDETVLARVFVAVILSLQMSMVIFHFHLACVHSRKREAELAKRYALKLSHLQKTKNNRQSCERDGSTEEV